MTDKPLSNGDRHVLIIGGSGYIGYPVTRSLLTAGFRVRNLDLHTYGHQAAITGHLLEPGYEFVFGDMGNRDALERALSSITDVVILAGLVGDPITKKYPDESALINDHSIQSCLNALNGRGLRNVIFVSTCSNYGMIGENEIADEAFRLDPLSLYAKSKVAAEKHILSLEGKVDYHPTVLRFATAFGVSPRMRFDLTVNEFTRDLFLDRELLVYDAHTWRPYCHIADFGRLIRHVLKAPLAQTSFETFNAGSDENNFTKQGIIDLICSRLPNRRITYRENSSDPRNYRVNFQKLKNKLDFTCKYPLAHGIDELLDALSKGLFDDVEQRRDFYGNYNLIRSAMDDGLPKAQAHG